MTAERAVVEIELVPNLVVDRLRNAYRARLRERLEPGGDVDPVAEDIVAVDDHIDDARKIRQQAVTGRADDPSAVRGDQRVDGAAQFAESLMRAGLILAHKPAETGHIGVQDGRELSLPSRSLLRNIRRVIE